MCGARSEGINKGPQGRKYVLELGVRSGVLEFRGLGLGDIIEISEMLEFGRRRHAESLESPYNRTAFSLPSFLIFILFYLYINIK